jgi:HAD superfamily hydrolase (TIGR01509 family)
MTAKRRFRAVIFDMDGVLVDSEPLFLEAINATLAPYGRGIDEEQHRRVMGLGPRESVVAILDISGLGASLDVDEFMDAYDVEVLARLGQQSQPLPGIRETIDMLNLRGIPLGLASSSRMTWIEATLRAIGMQNTFDAAVSGTEVENPKPAPDVYLAAAAKLAVPPADCIAIEDSPTGVRSASAAGLYTVQLRASSTAFPPQPQADVVVSELADLKFHELLGFEETRDP